MAMATYSIRMDPEVKSEFDKLCENIGLSASTAFNIFAKRSVRERAINLPLSASEEYAWKKDPVARKGMKALESMQKNAIKNGTADMSLDEINAEIATARKEAREKAVE